MKFKPRKIDDSVVEIEGWVTATTNEGTQKAENTILYQGLAEMWYLVAINGLNTIYPGVQLGTDTSTPTTVSTTQLVSTITPGFPSAGTILSTDGATYWACVVSTQYPASWFTTTWTIGELGLITNTYDVTNSTLQAGVFSRLAVADGTMSTISVNGSTYLNILWSIEFKFGG